MKVWGLLPASGQGPSLDELNDKLLENRDPRLESEFVGVQNVRWCLRVATRRTFLGGVTC